MPKADRISLDDHPYICFNTQSAAPMSSYAQTPCNTWAATFNTSMGAFGLTTAGEFSNAVTDCGLWLNGVGLGTRYDGTFAGNWPVVGSCTPWTDWQSWNTTMKTDIVNFALASMDALQVGVFPIVLKSPRNETRPNDPLELVFLDLENWCLFAKWRR